jgi:hypothetical protein
MTTSDKPFNNAEVFFKREEDDRPVIPKRPPNLGARNVCAWCLQSFDLEKQERAIWERGRLRTNLKMADNGTELVCCDNCWSGAAGYAMFIHGRVVPPIDPEDIPNPLLKASISE